MTKKEIRKEYALMRNMLSAEQHESYTNLILDIFKDLRLPELHVLFSYHPINERSEFDVIVCEQWLKKRNRQLIIAHPRTGEDHEMEAVVVNKQSLYSTGRFNIREPKEGDAMPPELIDMIFVPLLAFDKKGYRVGYGKGYYDRFLSLCRKDALRIGFSFFDPVTSIDDIDQFDVPLNICITPTRVYEF